MTISESQSRTIERRELLSDILFVINMYLIGFDLFCTTVRMYFSSDTLLFNMFIY